MTTTITQVHLTDADYEAWEQGCLSPERMERFLTHTAGCPHCADAWMAHLARQEEMLAEPPAYLAQEITERVHQPDVVIAQKAYTTSKRVQLLLYSLKVGVALAASIYMIFAMDAHTLEYVLQLIHI